MRHGRCCFQVLRVPDVHGSSTQKKRQHATDVLVRCYLVRKSAAFVTLDVKGGGQRRMSRGVSRPIFMALTCPYHPDHVLFEKFGRALHGSRERVTSFAAADSCWRG